MVTRKQSTVPLIDIESTAFAEQYEYGVWWSMYGDEQGKGPVPASYLVANLKIYGKRRCFKRQDPSSYPLIGFFLGMHHGGVLVPSTGQLRPDVTTLACLDHPDAKRGYRAGREFFFVDAEPHERRMTESYLLERLCEGVSEMIEWKNGEDTWFFFIECLLGELSGLLFPMTQHEQKVYLPQYQQVQQARNWHLVNREQQVSNATLQA